MPNYWHIITLNIKFIKVNFPEFDRFGNPYTLEETDEVKINGDLETFRN